MYKIPQESTLTERINVELLPQQTQADIIQHTMKVMQQQNLPKSYVARSAFLEQALSRDDFLPQHLKDPTDEKRGKLSRVEYLFLHEDFRQAFSDYIPKSAEITDAVQPYTQEPADLELAELD